jgi:hypothetical protein
LKTSNPSHASDSRSIAHLRQCPDFSRMFVPVDPDFDSTHNDNFSQHGYGSEKRKFRPVFNKWMRVSRPADGSPLSVFFCHPANFAPHRQSPIPL